MSKNRDEESLVDIYNAGTDIIIFTGGVDQQDFQSDKEKLNATLYSIQIIGEATKRLSAEFLQINSFGSILTELTQTRKSPPTLLGRNDN